MAKIRTLTDDDIRLLQRVIDKVKAEPANARGRTLPSNQPEPAAAMYVAFVPLGGIPGRVSLTVSSAVCTMYQQVGGVLVDAGFSRRLFNLSTDDIGGETLTLAKQDNWGTWWAVNAEDANLDGGPGPGIGTGTGTADSPGWPGTGTSPSAACPLTAEQLALIAGVGLGVDATGDCPTLKVVTTPVVCPTISFEEVEIICEDMPGTGTGPRAGNLNLYRRKVYLDVVDGCLVQTYGSWLFQNTIACCDPTCYSGGVGTGTGDGVTGTGGGVSSIETVCCPDGIPSVLTMTIVSGCDGATAVQTMTYDPLGVGGAGWFTEPEVVGANTLYWVWRCVGPTDWQLEKNCDGNNFTSAETAIASCDPYDSGEVAMPISGDCCSGAEDAIVRITE